MLGRRRLEQEVALAGGRVVTSKRETVFAKRPRQRRYHVRVVHGMNTSSRLAAAALWHYAAVLAVGAQQQAEHVVVFGVDGLSAKAVDGARSPNMRKLMGKGAWTLRARAILPTVSAPNWSAMIMGAAPDFTGVTGNDWFPGKSAIAPFCNDGASHPPTIFGALRKANPQASSALFTDWSGFVRLVEPRAASRIFEKEEDERGVVEAAIAHLAEARPALTFIHVDNVDHAGHEVGWHTPAYYDAVRAADSLLGAVLAAIEKAGMSGTAVLVTADHGGHGTTHGAMSQSDIEIPWIAAGPGIPANREIMTPVSTTQTAPTIAAWLGIPIPECWVARPVADAIRTGAPK